MSRYVDADALKQNLKENYTFMLTEKERASDDKCRLHKAYVGRTII